MHLEGVRKHHLEGEEVTNLQLVSYGKAGPPFIKVYPTVDHPERDPLVAAGGRPLNDFRYDVGHVFTETSEINSNFSVCAKIPL